MRLHQVGRAWFSFDVSPQRPWNCCSVPSTRWQALAPRRWAVLELKWDAQELFEDIEGRLMASELMEMRLSCLRRRWRPRWCHSIALKWLRRGKRLRVSRL